ARKSALIARRWPALVEAEAVGDGGGLDPGVNVELGEDVGDVDAGGFWADEQCLGDLAGGGPRRGPGGAPRPAAGQAPLGGGGPGGGGGGGGGGWGGARRGRGLALGVGRGGAWRAGEGGGAAQPLGGGVAVAGGGQQRFGVAEAGVGGPVGLAEPLPRRRR